MHSSVSSEQRTVASPVRWKAVRMYCVRTDGRSLEPSQTLAGLDELVTERAHVLRRLPDVQGGLRQSRCRKCTTV